MRSIEYDRGFFHDKDVFDRITRGRVANKMGRR